MLEIRAGQTDVERARVQKEWNDPNAQPQPWVLLLSAKVAFQGGNFHACCSFVIVLGHLHNENIFYQVVGRVVRVDQPKPVTVVQLHVVDSIYDFLLWRKCRKTIVAYRHELPDALIPDLIKPHPTATNIIRWELMRVACSHPRHGFVHEIWSPKAISDFNNPEQLTMGVVYQRLSRLFTGELEGEWTGDEGRTRISDMLGQFETLHMYMVKNWAAAYGNSPDKVPNRYSWHDLSRQIEEIKSDSLHDTVASWELEIAEFSYGSPSKPTKLSQELKKQDSCKRKSVNSSVIESPTAAKKARQA